MPDEILEIRGVRVLLCAAEGATLSKPQDANGLIAEARGQPAQMVALPKERLEPAFFQLRTGLAGEFLQKFVTYGVKLALIGDFAPLAAESKSLRDLIRESNRGHDVWFLKDFGELEQRLKA
jgi:hypothetical protein